VARDGLSEDAYMFFSSGPFFEGEDFEARTSESERKATWLKHREAIIERYHREHPEQHDRKTWGETLERLEAESDANE
jgi:hypothetical protein